ncbi:Arc family DNA-binding protein [Leucobacter viscericola]|uniref:Arc family DNA-binding protein n=1 Tax=Leucobacter viscericola TaxID=2714935 RepID=A0A6G7XFQ1_9MICO|nr:Arc family DNA-binding protein [Leucobacter viscericola]QIK63296.1 Arc family DNA-binding protein [Leucobacter viscericola]
MAQLLIRQLPDEVKEGLRERARASGRSMEAEARAILTDFIFPTNEVSLEYDGPQDATTLFERYGVKILPSRPEGGVVSFEETQALIDEFA